MRNVALAAVVALGAWTLYGIGHGIWVLVAGSPNSNPAVVAVSVGVLVIIFALTLRGGRKLAASGIRRS
jgi:hypothetical protein